MVSSNLAMSDRRVSRQSAFGTVDLLGPIPSSDANGPSQRHHGICAEEPHECVCHSVAVMPLYMQTSDGVGGGVRCLFGTCDGVWERNWRHLR